MLGNVGLERAVIASLCKHGKMAMVEMEDLGVGENSFTLVTNQALFTCIKHVLDNKDTVDYPVLWVTIQDLGFKSLFEDKKDAEYISSLFNFPIKAENIRGLAVRLEKLALARKAISKHEEAIASLNEITGAEPIETIIQVSENPIFDLIVAVNQQQNSGPVQLFSDIEELVQELKDNPCDNIGIPTPWACWNAAIGRGLRRGGVNLVGARPKIGKTTFAKETLLHFSDVLKVPVLMLDTEMSDRDQKIRSLSSYSEVPLEDIETGKFGNNRLYCQFLDDAVEKLKHNKCFWYASIAGKPFEEVLATIRRWIVKEVGYDDEGRTKDCVIVYDYFKLMDRSQLQSLKEYEAMGYQISRLTDFCKEFDFACLAFVQLNRQNDISQSDRLRWLCHSYSQFELKTPEEKVNDGKEGGNRKLTVMDTRFGKGLSDNDYICLNFKGDINKLTEIGLKSQLHAETKDDTEFERQDGKSVVVSSEIVEPIGIEYSNGDDKEENQEDDQEVPWDE
jgi:replicative DNA helicase